MNYLRSKSGLIVLVAGAVVPLLLVLGAQKGTGQEKAVGAAAAKPAQEWTAESHDKSNFPLVGKHRTLGCRECHLNLVFEGAPTDCEVCHWQRRQDDRYGLRLGMRCADCHTPQSWKKVDPSKWSHETDAGFRLEGIHRTLDCEACHGSGGFAHRPTDCYSCHQSDYQRTREPNHVESGFPTTCSDCHSQRAWEGASFNHTGFVLKGRHASTACADCHKNGVYAGTPTECAACHLADYNGTTDPNHRSAGFPLDCTECHGDSADGWGGADDSHTAFTLSGSHASAACSDCHKNGVYSGTSPACAACHLADFNGTTDPNHSSAGFPLDCTGCHGTSANGWTGAGFTHTAFALSGRHASAACSDCHKNGVYAGTSPACASCHLADYNGTTDPNHSSAGFPLDCTGCHGTSANGWTGASFVHDFPIQSGHHGGLACSECHRTSDFRSFSCLECHAHDKTDMDSEHRGVTGYSYNSQACLACHPRGTH